MAKLNQKFVIQNSQGQEQELDIYTTVAEATNENRYIKLQIPIDGKATTCYIGLTKDIDTLKASDMYVLENEDEWRARKYMGIKDFRNYMKNTYPDTYQTITELPQDFPDTSDGTYFYSCFTNCGVEEYDIDLRNATLIQYCWEDAKAKKINIKNAKKIQGSLKRTFRDCTNLISLTGDVDTSKCTEFTEMLRMDSKLQEIGFPIDLSSIKEITTGVNGNFYAMLLNCLSLKSITFNNVPISITEEQLRYEATIPQNCEVIINYRQIKPQTPIRIIKAENMKLVDIDVNGDMPIIREGDKPLDEYIVNSGDWGTIYDDGANFKCFVTKDNLIYCGAGYNSTNRKEFQPEIPDGIEVPNCSFNIEHRGTVENYSYLMTNVSFKSWEVPLIRGNRFTAPYEYYRIDNYSYTNDDILISDYYQIAIKNTQKKQISVIDRYQIGEMPLSFTYGRIREQSFSQFNIYEGQLFAEELEAELNKIKGGSL